MASNGKPSPLVVEKRRERLQTSGKQAWRGMGFDFSHPRSKSVNSLAPIPWMPSPQGTTIQDKNATFGAPRRVTKATLLADELLMETGYHDSSTDMQTLRLERLFDSEHLQSATASSKTKKRRSESRNHLPLLPGAAARRAAAAAQVESLRKSESSVLFEPEPGVVKPKTDMHYWNVKSVVRQDVRLPPVFSYGPLIVSSEMSPQKARILLDRWLVRRFIAAPI
jgi:hypothetical protein